MRAAPLAARESRSGAWFYREKHEIQRLLYQIGPFFSSLLGTVRGDALKKSVGILGAKSSIVSLVGPPDAAFARSRGLNFFMKFAFGLLSGRIIRQAGKRGAVYSFLFVRPDGGQLAEIGKLLTAGKIRPVIDKVFPFEQAKEALAHLEKGRAKGKVVVQMR